MGNVLATSKPITASGPGTPSSIPAGFPELSKDTQPQPTTIEELKKNYTNEDRGNPGYMEELHKKCKGD